MSEFVVVAIASLIVLAINFVGFIVGGFIVKRRFPPTPDEWLVSLSGAAVVTFISVLIRYTL